MDIVEAARGKWHGILPQLGIDSKYLVKRHGPCPMCGGKDRFIFDNKEGRGTYHCNQCGAGSGLQLVSAVHSWSMANTVKEVGKIVGNVEAKEPEQQQTEQQKRDAMNKVWNGAIVLQDDDLVYGYLASRIGGEFPHPSGAIRLHKSLWHPEERQSFPAMVAKVTDLNNKPVSIHRTFLNQDGTSKAKIKKAKMLMSSTIPDGSAIRLMPYSHVLGIAEGIETAFSASMIFGIPVWAAISASIMVKWLPPDIVEKVVIFGDNDKNFVGQLSAYRLAHTLMRDYPHKKIVVAIPNIGGADWNDVLQIHGHDKAKEEAAIIAPDAFLFLP